MAFTDTSGSKYNKIILVRMQYGQFISSFSDLGSGLYEYQIAGPIAKITRNKLIPMTKVTGTPTSDDEYSHDEAAGTLTVKLASAPNETSNVLIFYTYLFYTNEKNRRIPETPDSPFNATTNPYRNWDSRVASVPTFTQSIKNSLSGILSTAVSSLDIINTDNALNFILQKNNSFANKDVEMWLALDDETSIEKVYRGNIVGLRITDTICTFRFTDPTNKLDAPAWMGDTDEEAYYRREVGQNIDINDEDTPRRFHIGPHTRASIRDDESMSTATDTKSVVFESLQRAVLIDRVAGVGASALNRDFDLGRSLTSMVDTSATITATVAGGSGSNFYTFTPNVSSSGADFTIGQGVSVDGYATSYRVIRIDTNGDVTITWLSPDATPSNGTSVTGDKITLYKGTGNSSFTRLNPSVISVVNDINTTGGNKKTTIQLSGVSYDPDAEQIRFIGTYQKDSTSDSTIVSRILDRSGVIPAGSGITFDAQTTSASILQFSIPYFDETDYEIYRDYVERILLTVNGLLILDEDEISYRSILEPVSQASTITTRDTLQNSRVIDVDYRDIAYITTGFNPHSQVSESGDASSKHRYLHDTEKATRFRHLAVELNSTVEDLKSKINRNRKAVYTHSTFARDLGKIPSDDMTLEHDNTPNPNGTTDVFLTEVSKSTRSTRVRSTDILDD